ncbi:uncharacterized protein LOC103706403 [Phoenix dactylifera]|uniref:Uncharacterized protein LOC103706403 n=1 Tax=Phoenix dactylifera TaxID=42345 RepID=A0A8B7BZR0_PHODC|nr:uncharacterized protein LOC103706403 [Phoenix dactylifera]XP_038970813.1 uncharacterized protein LOC103706403 [Phoenix dactylifera]
MKCRNHPYELGVGVCASCLRERLLALIAAQNELPAENHCQQPDLPSQPPLPLVFPRSGSPYVSHRRSVGSDACPAYGRHFNHRFFSTPQVGPTFDAACGGYSGDADEGRRRISGRFSVFSILFRHQRSEEAESDLGNSRSSGSGSWFSALIPRRRKKKPRSFSVPEAATGRSRPSCRASDRGMSPEIDDDEADGCSSGYSTESSSGWRRPTPTPMRRFPASSYHYHGGRSGVSSFAVCLSPLIRVGHNGRRGTPAESGMISGELRSTGSRPRCRPWSARGASLGPSRSRKLADLGRFD